MTGAAPSGTVITTVIYKAKLDGDGNPVKDAGGRYIKSDLAAYAVMEKRTGWGTEYPPEKRNGEWRIADRMVVFDSERIDPITSSSAPLSNPQFGRRDRSDPSYKYDVVD